MPKYDTSLEATFIALLVDNPQFIDLCDVEADDFYHLNHQEAFKALQRLRRESKEISLPILGIELDKKGVDIHSILYEIQGDGILPSQLYPFQSRIKELSVIREQAKIMEEFKDPAEVIEKMKLLSVKLETKKPKTLSEAFEDYKKQYAERKAKDGQTGLYTGFEKLDKYAPMERGTLNILAARSSIGKSALALTIARNVAEYKQTVLFISAEMSIPRLMDRLLAMISGIPAGKFRQGVADIGMSTAQATIDRLKDYLQFIYLPYGTSEDVARITAKETARRHIDLVVVDYLQYLRDHKGRSETEATRIGNMTRNLKGLAASHDCAVLALSQVNRQSSQNTEGMPELHQLRDSGAIEQDADSVFILNRGERSDTLGKLVIAKNRNGEADITINLKFNAETTEYTEKKEIVQATEAEIVNMFS